MKEIIGGSFPETYIPKSSMPFARMVMLSGLAVHGQLDATLLEVKFEEFINKWPLLKGRLLVNESPRAYASSGGDIDFKSRKLSKTLEEALGISYSDLILSPRALKKTYNAMGIDKRIPPNEIEPDEPWLGYTPMKFTSEYFYWSHPTTVEDSGYETLLALRVTVLTDGTLLGFRMPHYFVDGADMFKVISAFCTVYNIGEHKLPTLILPPDVGQPMSSHIDMLTPLTPTGEAASPELLDKLLDSITTGKLPRSIPELIATSMVPLVTPLLHVLAPMLGAVTKKRITLPFRFVASLQYSCQLEIDTLVLSGLLDTTSIPGIHLSKADIIAAWFARESFSCYPSSVNHLPVILHYAFNYRPHLTPGLLPKDTTYLHNSNWPLTIRWPSLAAFQRCELWEIALAIRVSVVKARLGSEVKKTLEFWEARQTDFELRPGGSGEEPGLVAAVTTGTNLSYEQLKWGGVKMGTGETLLTDIRATGAPPICPYAFVTKGKDEGYELCAINTEMGWKGHE